MHLIVVNNCIKQTTPIALLLYYYFYYYYYYYFIIIILHFIIIIIIHVIHKLCKISFCLALNDDAMTRKYFNQGN